MMLHVLVDGAIEVEVAAVEDVFRTVVKGAATGEGAHSDLGFFFRRTFRAV